MTTTEAVTPQPGFTCTVGNGKTRWEIISLSQSEVALSKVGGDGYTNKWAKVHELMNVRPNDPDKVTLGKVLNARLKLVKATKALDDRARHHAKPEEITKLVRIVNDAAAYYNALYTRHQEGN